MVKHGENILWRQLKKLFKRFSRRASIQMVDIYYNYFSVKLTCTMRKYIPISRNKMFLFITELSQLEDLNTNRITRILTTDFPQYFAIVSRIRQEVHAIGPEGIVCFYIDRYPKENNFVTSTFSFG